MKSILWLSLLAFAFNITAQDNTNLYVVNEFSVGQKVGLLRAVPVSLGDGKKGLFLVYSADKDIDPFVEMFYFPTDRLHFKVVTLTGELIWEKEAEPGIFNGIWFVPIFPFDMDQDGVDEIYYVGNIHDNHALSINGRRLRSLDAKTGNELGTWDWKDGTGTNVRMSHRFRNFIMGGFVGNDPVLLTAQGTYGQMSIQAWNPKMEKRWELVIEDDNQGARGSHQTPVVDIDMDGTEELLWGERCINIDKGEVLWVADKDEYIGHSDVIQPTFNRKEGEWYVYTCRENDDRGNTKPRVVMFNNKGERVWKDLENGHMDMGWTAHTGKNGEALAYTISRGGKMAGPEGFFRLDVVEYTYDAWTGERINLPFKAYNSIPVDLDGDGLHEFACAHQEQSDWKVYDADGTVLGTVGEKGYVAIASKFLDLPGEQLLTYYPDGKIRIWAYKGAKDNKLAKSRYANRFYMLNQKQSAQGYNMVTLGGL